MRSLTIVTSYALDEPVVRNRISPIVECVLSRGCTVTLVLPTTRNLELRHPELFTRQVGREVDRGRGFIRRAISEAHLSCLLLRAAREIRSDAILITIPSMFLLLLSRIRPGQSAYMDIRDLAWEYLGDLSVFSRFVKKALRAVAATKLRNFQLISHTNATERRILESSMKVPCERLYYLPNGVGRAQLNDLVSLPPKSSNNDAMVVSYIGNIGVAQNLEFLVRAARKFPKCYFNLVGDGGDLNRVRDVKEKVNANNVFILGRVSWSRVIQVYRETDILYAQLSPNFRDALPSKLYEYLATGRPIIFGGGGEAATFLKQFENVCVIEPNSVGSIEKALLFALEKKGRRLSCVNRRRIAAEFVRETNVQGYYQRMSITK